MGPVTVIREQKMLDAILAGFQDNPSLVCESQQATFNGCLNSLAAHEDFPKLMAAAAQEMSVPDASEKLASVVMGMVKRAA